MVHSKAFASVLAAALGAAVVALTGDNHFSTVELINVAIAIVAAIGVAYFPNTDEAPAAKSILAALMAVLVLATDLIAGGLNTSEWLQLALAGLGALGVWFVPNKTVTARKPAVQ
jgi:hypothetical protein